MARIRSHSTSPERLVRRLVFGLGYRYRLRSKDVPGKPDLVFRSRKKVIFVHGCFWHKHIGCKRASNPKSRQAYWGPKLARNVARDRTVRQALARKGWSSFVVWECQCGSQNLIRKLQTFLDS